MVTVKQFLLLLLLIEKNRFYLANREGRENIEDNKLMSNFTIFTNLY